jgi:hypothetical protein
MPSRYSLRDSNKDVLITLCKSNIAYIFPILMFILPTILFIGFDTLSRIDSKDECAVTDQVAASNTAVFTQYSLSEPKFWSDLSALGNDVSFLATSNPESGSPESLFAFAFNASQLECLSRWMSLFRSSRRKETGVLVLSSSQMNQSRVAPLWAGDESDATRFWKVADKRLTCGSYKTVKYPSAPDAPSRLYSRLSSMPELSNWAGEVCVGSIQAFYLSTDLWTPFQDLVRQLKDTGDQEIPKEISIPTILFLLEHLYD